MALAAGALPAYHLGLFEPGGPPSSQQPQRMQPASPRRLCISSASVKPSLRSRTQPTLRRTYSTLISAGRGRTRLQQLIDWVGGAAFEGVICLDECHKGDPQGPAGWEPGLRQGQRLSKGRCRVLSGPWHTTAQAWHAHLAASFRASFHYFALPAAPDRSQELCAW